MGGVAERRKYKRKGLVGKVILHIIGRKPSITEKATIMDISCGGMSVNFQGHSLGVGDEILIEAGGSEGIRPFQAKGKIVHCNVMNSNGTFYTFLGISFSRLSLNSFQNLEKFIAA